MSSFTGIAPVDRLLADAEETRNKQGNRRRQIFLSADRYLFDFNMNLHKWEQFDTTSDAWYFGVWVNKAERRMLHYVEGDVFLTLCDDPESYDAEIAAMCVYYEPAPAFVAIDVEKGQRTDYYQGRVQFFIDPARANVPDIPEPKTATEEK